MYLPSPLSWGSWRWLGLGLLGFTIRAATAHVGELFMLQGLGYRILELLRAAMLRLEEIPGTAGLEDAHDGAAWFAFYLVSLGPLVESTAEAQSQFSLVV